MRSIMAKIKGLFSDFFLGERTRMVTSTSLNKRPWKTLKLTDPASVVA